MTTFRPKKFPGQEAWGEPISIGIALSETEDCLPPGSHRAGYLAPELYVFDGQIRR